MDKKLCVYAICKNESKFIDRWMNSLIGEADCVSVLDTGSTDDSVEKLKKYGDFVRVEKADYSKQKYFKFDKARNDSLKLVPFDADICVVLDLDQVPRKGWSKVIRKCYDEGYNEIYGTIIDHDENGNEVSRWMSKNVHPNNPYYIWKNIIHEGIDYRGDNSEEFVKWYIAEDFIIDHYPDLKKDRSNYLKLLGYAVEDNPKSAYYGIYYGLELSNCGFEEESHKAFIRALNECDFSTRSDKDIKYQLYINAADKCDFDEALEFLEEATIFGEQENIHTRRLYDAYAVMYERTNNVDQAIAYLEEALNAVKSYTNDWRDDFKLFNGNIEDRLSLFYYYKHDYLKAIEYCSRALQYNSDDTRINSNLQYYYNEYIKSKGNK